MASTTTSVVRGCGTRVKGGIYACCNQSPFGRPIEEFIIDAERADVEALGVTPVGVRLIERDSIWHVLDWVGESFYPNAADMIEETRRFGLSRRLPQTLDYSRLSQKSRIILIHSRAWLENANEYYQALIREGAVLRCPTGNPEHTAYAPFLGRPDEPMPTEPERFWSKVKYGPGCWEWQASDKGNGYGQYWHDGQMVPAHRYAYEIQHRDLQPGEEACHRCDNQPCVRGSHLFASSHAGNMADARAKARIHDATGERASGTKLDASQVEEIRRRVAAGEKSRSIAGGFGIDRSHVSRIANGRYWTEPNTTNVRLTCAGLWWEDLRDGIEPQEDGDQERAVRRTMPSLTYVGRSTPPVEPRYSPGFLASFPISNLALIRDPDAPEGIEDGKLARLERSALAVEVLDE